MATVIERVSVLEAKVQNNGEKLDEIKIDVRELHDCLDRTGDDLKATLKDMHEQSCKQHETLAGKISELENFKQKWVYTIAGALVVIGWVTAHAETVARIFK
jgi:chromosome condensin MukBEF complex kleisin-like MukF subunit